MRNNHAFAMTGLAVIALALFFPRENNAQVPPTQQLISESALLTGLAPGALFPFIDTTPHRITSAHIAITDATSSCAPGAAAPSNADPRWRRRWNLGERHDGGNQYGHRIAWAMRFSCHDQAGAWRCSRTSH